MSLSKVVAYKYRSKLCWCIRIPEASELEQKYKGTMTNDAPMPSTMSRLNSNQAVCEVMIEAKY
jgi:hypothetical protein